MTDENTDFKKQPGVFDDDRLLAFALGLEDDPELLAAAAADPELDARLEAMRADVGRIGAQVAAAVPAPEAEYTDLSGERWPGLKEYFQAPADVSPRRQRRWWRVVAPVAAVLVLAIVVGIVAVNGGGVTGSSSTSSEVARTADDAAAPAQMSSGGQKTVQPSALRETFSQQLSRFAVVVLARARQATGSFQDFAVLRIFKGDAPQVVELAVDGRPADQGRLHLLMLDPTTTPAADVSGTPSSVEPLLPSGSPWASESPLASESPWPDALSPEPIPSLAADGGPGQPLAVSYTYNGQPTAVREFSAGTDPDSVTIVIP